MKQTLIILSISIIIAIITGWSIAKYRITHPPYDEQTLIKYITPSVPVTPSNSKQANATDSETVKQFESVKRPVVNVERIYNFGVLQNGEVGKHQFVIKNRGDVDLTLKIQETSCKCTAADLSNGIVKPGLAGQIDVSWKTADFIGDYTQKVLVQTNDPEMSLIELEVRGKIVADARPVPSEFTFTNITYGSSAKTEVQIACYKNPPLKITGHEFLNPEMGKHFDVKIDTLTKEEYQGEPDATGGYRITLTAKETLPRGSFSETLVLKTDSQPQPELKIPVVGKVIGNLSLAGPGWSEESKTWILGVLEQGVEGKKILWVLDRSVKPEDRVNTKPGEIPSHVKLTVDSVEPSWLKVELGQPNFLPESGVVRTIINLTVPENAPICDYWGHVEEKMGQIILKTSSEEEKSILINIRFAITNKQK